MLGTSWCARTCRTGPQAGKVDGSAHIIGDHGYIFLFNPNPMPLEDNFILNESIGLTKGSRYRISSMYPKSAARVSLGRGEMVKWEVGGQSASILEIAPE